MSDAVNRFSMSACTTPEGRWEWGKERKKKREKALLTTITLRWYKHTLWKDHKTN